MLVYEEVGRRIGSIVQKKNEVCDSYSKTGEAMLIFYPDGIRPDQYGDALLMGELLGKLIEASKQKSQTESPWEYVGRIGICGIVRDLKKKKLDEIAKLEPAKTEPPPVPAELEIEIRHCACGHRPYRQGKEVLHCISDVCSYSGARYKLAEWNAMTDES
jgi:hypothetical protein